MRAALVVLTACAVLAGCRAPIAPGRSPERTVVNAEGEEAVVVPSRWCGSYIVVDVDVNGAGPFAMLLDTGSDATVFDTSLGVRMADAVLDDSEIVRGAEGEELEVLRQLRVESLRAGGVELSGFDAVLLDLGAISDALGEPIDGVLGFRCFYEVLLTIDYPARAVRVGRGTLSDVGFTNVTAMRGVRTPSVALDIEGEEVFALIDTAGTPALSLDAWSSYALETPPTPIGTGVSIGGVHVLERGRLASDVTASGIVFERPLFSPTSGGVKFGTEMLEPFAITFDQRSRLVRFKRPGFASEPVTFGAQRGLGVGFDRRSDAWVVLRVFEGGPGELREGDRVLAIDGEPVGSLGCGRYRSMMETLDGCTLSVERSGATLEVEAPVRTLVP